MDQLTVMKTEQKSSAKPTEQLCSQCCRALTHHAWLVKIAYAWTIPKSMRTSEEEAAKPGAQSEAPTAGSSVRNVRGGRFSLLQHTLDVELEARFDAIKADKKHKEIEHNRRMECMREEHKIKIRTLKEQRKNCNIQHKIMLRILKEKEEVQKLKQALLRKQLQAADSE